MKFETALKIVELETNEQTAERIVELYDIIENKYTIEKIEILEKRLDELKSIVDDLQKDRNGGYQSPQDQILGGF